MESVQTKLVRRIVENLYGNDFQSFVEELYLLSYGTNFRPIKPKRDKGCDGILENERCVLAVYGPERRDLRSFKRKIKEDYGEYQNHWQVQYPCWQFIYNKELTAEEHLALVNLKHDVLPIGISHIVKQYELLSWSSKRRLGTYLGIDSVCFHNDVLSNVLDDLIGHAPAAQDLPYGQPSYIEDKIKLNYAPDDIASATDQYLDCLEFFPTLERLLAGFLDRDLSALRSRIRRDYNALGGSFKNRFDALVTRYSEVSSRDDVYWFYVEVVLVYYFERCLIGRKTDGENT